jgi:hypothetical protein
VENFSPCGYAPEIERNNMFNLLNMNINIDHAVYLVALGEIKNIPIGKIIIVAAPQPCHSPNIPPA